MATADLVRSGTVGAAGTARLDVRAFGRQVWTVRQVTVNGTIAGATSVGSSATCSMFKNGTLVTRIVAQGGVAVEPPPVIIRGNDVLSIRWASATVGAAVEIFVIYDDGMGPA